MQSSNRPLTPLAAVAAGFRVGIGTAFWLFSKVWGAG
jgi:hypothetical protein